MIECNHLQDWIVIDQFHLRSNRNKVFHMIDCYPDSPIYEEVILEYSKLEKESKSIVEPTAIIQFGKLVEPLHVYNHKTDELACYVFYTIGDRIKNLSRQYFDEENYLAGMLVNAIADDYIIQMDRELENLLRKECQKRNFGVSMRLEIPKDVPMEAQEVVLKITKADKVLNIKVTEGYMFTIVKSNCFILVLTDDCNCMNLKHDCMQCAQKDCKLRKI